MAQSVPQSGTARRRVSYRTLLAVPILFLVHGLFTYNNLAPFLGLDHAGPMWMVSGVAHDMSNHLLPRHPLSDAFDYVRITRFAARHADTSTASEFKAFAIWADRRDRPVSLNFIRYHVRRICDSSPNQWVQLAFLTRDRRTLKFENACAEPSMLWYSVLSSYRECEPTCQGVIRRWAARELSPARPWQ